MTSISSNAQMYKITDLKEARPSHDFEKFTLEYPYIFMIFGTHISPKVYTNLDKLEEVT